MSKRPYLHMSLPPKHAVADALRRARMTSRDNEVARILARAGGHICGERVPPLYVEQAMALRDDRELRQAMVMILMGYR